MKKLLIPNFGEIIIKNIIFDINGTLQFKGLIPDNLLLKFRELKKLYNIFLVSSDTRGNLKDLASKLGVDYVKIAPKGITDTEAKNQELLKLGKDVTIAVGNGNNDALMLKNAVLGIVIIGSEGASTQAIMNADVAFPDPISVIDFLMDETMIIATLRK